VSALSQRPFLGPTVSLHASNSHTLPRRAFPSASETRSNLAVFLHWEFVLVFRDHLNANMVSTGSEMFVNAGQDRFQISPGNHSINEPIAAAVGEIGFSESQPQKVIGVIGKRKVERKELSRQRACLSRICFQDDRLLRTQKRFCTQHLSGMGCML